MKQNELHELVKQQDKGALIATFLSAREPRTIGEGTRQQTVVDYSVMVSRGATLRVSVFTPIGSPATGTSVAGLKFGDRVVCVGYTAGLKDGYLNASAESVEIIG
jgi:hypothetical protein